jgi:hypothetical protein
VDPPVLHQYYYWTSLHLPKFTENVQQQISHSQQQQHSSSVPVVVVVSYFLVDRNQ